MRVTDASGASELHLARHEARARRAAVVVTAPGTEGKITNAATGGRVMATNDKTRGQETGVRCKCDRGQVVYLMSCCLTCFTEAHAAFMAVWGK